LKIWIDADGCPREVRNVALRASDRRQVAVCLVANAVLPTGGWPQAEAVAVGGQFNAADDHIAESVAAGDLVVTADIPLAARVVEQGAVAIDPRGEVYDESNVGERLSMRNFMKGLRASGFIQGGPASFSKADKGRFADALDRLLTKRLGQRPADA
jgi:uncharacterized protein YaiI (UPF0178 family)